MTLQSPVNICALLAFAIGCGGDDPTVPDTGSTPTETGLTTSSPEVVLSVAVRGLLGDQLVLQNKGGDDLTVTADGTHAFGTPLEIGDGYEVTIVTQPLAPPQQCTITDGSGTATESPPTVSVTCESYHVAFVTSSQGTGDLGSWADAGGQTGLAAADAICQAHAARGSLPGTFVAWASDDTSDAYCRVAGFDGKIDANCGQATLPEAAGPWVRPDGLAFAGPLPRLARPHNEIVLPPTLDENGAMLDDRNFLSASDSDGEASRISPCENWTSAVPGSTSGGTTRSTILSNWGGQWCGMADSSLLCFQTGAGLDLPEAPEPPADGHLLFVTSTTTTGDMGGVYGADGICNALATAAGHAGTFEAWLYDGAIDAAGRMDHPGPWVRPDGYVVASTTTALLAGELLATPNMTETGSFATFWAWTGLDQQGAVGDTCESWTTAHDSIRGERALPYQLSEAWMAWGDSTCSQELRLYCYED